MALSSRSFFLIALIALILFTTHAHAFGAGNIASISAIEGKNWRHGDIEDLLKQVTCIKHHKWSSMMIKRVYFGNWLRDYSQAMDTGALKKAQPETIRILVWLLSFLGFGYATAEFEVTSERLGVYRPEEHIDNPKNYNDDQDARPYDPRLRAPVQPIELEVDLQTGMKNYIANGRGDWATSAAFVKYSFTQSIHHGRLYTSGSGIFSKGKDEDLAEACRMLGQGLHTLEDFGAHTNYVELALIELGHRNVFPLVGTNTQINTRGKRVYPLVTGTFGMIDFYHSVLGEATDHFTQSEVNEMDNAMGVAEQAATSSSPLATLAKLLSKVPGTGDLVSEAQKLQASSQAEARRNREGGGSRGLDGFDSSRNVEDYSSSRAGPSDYPGAGHYGANHGYNNYNQGQNYQQPGQGWNDYSQPPPPPHDQWNQGPQWQQPPTQQSWDNQSQHQWQQPPSNQQWQQSQPPQHDQWNQGSQWQQNAPSASAQSSTPQPPASGQQIVKPQGLVGMPDFDPSKTIRQIYPILVFRDKVVRTISGIIEKIPGLEALVERITETLTVFIFSLLAPFVRPLLTALQNTLQSSSEGVTEWNKQHQYEVWDDPNCSDPTHSMLSKDHFSNILNDPAGAVAGEILKFIAPRILYAWEHPEVPVERIMQDVESIFHHPALRDERGNECHKNMFSKVRQWSEGRRDIENLLNMQAVRQGKNHKDGVDDHAGHGSSMTSHGGGHKPPGGQGQGQAGGYNYGSYLHSAENVIGGLTGHPGQQHGGGGHSSQSQGGLGGIFQQAESFLGSGGSGHGSGHGSSSWGGGGGASSSSGGLGDMLSMASKLPGVNQYASELNKFSKFSSFLGGGKRELPGEGQRGLPEDDGDYGDSDKYRGFMGSSVGGGNELYESALRAERAAPTPSPGPMPVPSGYEQYGRGGDYHGQSGQGQGYFEGANEGYGYGVAQSGGYGSQQFGGNHGGGQSDGYYRG